MIEWQSIETAPKDGTKVLLARHGWLNHSDAEYGTEQWSKDVLGRDQAKVCAVVGLHRSSGRRNGTNWNDGIEPSGLNAPTHWMSLPPSPRRVSSLNPDTPASGVKDG